MIATIAKIAVIAAIAEKKSQRSQRSYWKPLSSDLNDLSDNDRLSLRSLEYGFHLIAMIAAITSNHSDCSDHMETRLNRPPDSMKRLETIASIKFRTRHYLCRAEIQLFMRTKIALHFRTGLGFIVRNG